MLNSYIIIDATQTLEKSLNEFQQFDEFICIGIFNDYATALNALLEKRPQLVFFQFSKEIPLRLLLDLKQYVDTIPYVIALNPKKKNAYNAIKYGVMDYILSPLEPTELRKTFLKYTKLSNKEKTEKLSIKSNGDYHFISLEDIVYLKADNNTTDFYLKNGKIISGFKTMKFFENQLPFYFFRIHNSYVVNIHFVSRINVGKANCYLLDNTYSLPFSRTYKNNIDTIIRRIG
ncbi:Two-component system response regulatory protein, LytTR family [Flavobacterium saliperosum S13]|uniref:Two component transcriptional regulator, LytTR family n=2 Tax=Flavobacterium saliperosum TaxID=329186 RepID=A0A1G4VF11_9FLAO|nr:LytTR family DNA-binding domain-containing protein [Flavobacterium saliperosum]ESU25671.1 Two-component system response regulatory protein, LytTR family [Flavobacterium saliperosum S13]SCX05832.1 two component transcriptional regulator, LytTR family [Flavobacterium saliperosum]